MKALRTALAATVLLLAATTVPTHAQTQWSIVPHVGFNVDNDEVYLGAAARIGLDAAPITLNPGFDYYPFIGTTGVDASLFLLNLDALYHLPARSVEPYVGGGLFWSRTSVSVGGIGSVSDNDVGLNVKGGVVFSTPGKLRPYVEGGLAISNGSALLLKGGLLFSIGG